MLAARLDQLVGVLERACELVARGGCFTERFDALVVEPGGELGERLDAMLKLADQRRAGVRQLGAFERGLIGVFLRQQRLRAGTQPDRGSNLSPNTTATNA